eukprot:8139-Heterococcus_DN1.PRE.6
MLDHHDANVTAAEFEQFQWASPVQALPFNVHLCHRRWYSISKHIDVQIHLGVYSEVVNWDIRHFSAPARHSQCNTDKMNAD